MHRIALLILITMLAACATPEPQSVDPNQYRLLFEKTRVGKLACIAAFDGSGLLYLVNKRADFNITEVSIYDPRTSLFAVVPVSYRGNASCRDIGFPSLTTLPTATLNFIEAEELRKVFDRYSADPNGLKNAITAGPPYFRDDGKWQGTRSALNLDLHSLTNIRTTDEVTTRLKAIDSKTAASMIRNRLTIVAAAISKEAQKRQEAKRAEESWDNRLSATYRIGDKVCTYDTNWFGYVDEIQPDRLKVHVVGRAVFAGLDVKGIFFTPQEGSFEYSRIDAVRWLAREEIAPCSFTDR